MLTVLNLKNHREEFFDYEDIYEGMEDERRNNFLKTLYERNKKGEINLYCTCVPNKEIPLVVSKKEITYYIKRKDASIEHSQSCKFDGEYVKTIKGWDMQADGSINVSLKDRIYSVHPFYNPRITNQLTLKEFAIHWMNFAWEIQSKNYLKNNKKEMSFTDFYSSLKYWATRIRFSERVMLKDLLGTGKGQAYNLLKTDLRMLVCLQFDKKEKLDKKNVLLSLKNPGMDYSVEVTCSAEVWKYAIDTLPVSKTPLMVIGFVELLKDKPLNLLDFVVIPISNEGVIVENEYEKKLFNALHRKKRSFIKSFDLYSVFKDNKPNILLIDSAVPTIVEIFERDRSDIFYYANEQRKLDYFSSLPNYKVIVWDAVHDEKLFKF